MSSMSPQDGWQPISRPASRAGAEAFHLSPFARLARAHALGAAGDVLVAIALANSLFFDLDPNDARWRVLLYLALTMAPLAVVAPFIGPVLDRSTGGRRWMMVGAHGARALVCLVMLNDLNSLLLFPEAFTVLALGKAYGVARSAIVPTVVRSDAELVEANSKLQLISGLASPVAAIPAGVAFAIARSPGVLALAIIAYLAAMLAALRVPATQIAQAPASAAETAELRSIGVVLASSAMGLVRGIVGFVTFLLLFELRDQPTWHMGLVLTFTGVGLLVGSALAPWLRRSMPEERMLIAALGVTVLTAVIASRLDTLVGASLMAATIALASTCAKVGFDSLVQRDAPDANRGRSFARFEVRFQLVWVVGAVIPVIISMPLSVGFVIIACTAGFALFSYLAGQSAAHRSHSTASQQRPRAEGGQDVPGAVDPTLAVDPTRVAPSPGTDPTQIL